VRLFVGTLLGPLHQRFYDRILEELLLRHPVALRRIPQNSAHLTFAFCARADQQHLDPIGDAVKEAADQHSGFDMTLGGGRVLWTGSKPRLVCADVLSGAGPLRRMTADILNQLQMACPELSWTGSRSPHLTLARFRRQVTRAEADAVARSVVSADGCGASRRVEIVAVDVVESHLTPQGPVYDIKRHMPLPTRS
jgi:2'-5' RNA ligase